MENQQKIDCSNIAITIRKLAKLAKKRLPANSASLDEAIRRTRNPVDYMRCAEFSALLNHITLNSGMRVLDIGSPQWFSIFLAFKFPKVSFTYINLSETELATIRDTASILGLSNIRYLQQDARMLQFADSSYDACISISVIEHIEPGIGGDELALQEIKRVLKPESDLWLTIPVKESSKIIFTCRPNYNGQRSISRGQYFFAREYNTDTFRKLIIQLGFTILYLGYIIEKPSPFALDYYIYGGGRDSIYGKIVRLLTKIIFRLCWMPLQLKIAEKNLSLASKPSARSANIIAHLRAPRT